MEDYITNIFVRLPEKSLCRFKLVSKKWNHFISYDPYFRRLYQSRNMDPSITLDPNLMLGLYYYDKLAIHSEQHRMHFVPTCDEARKLKMSRNAKVWWPARDQLHYILASSNGFLLCSQEQEQEQQLEEEEEPLRTSVTHYYICNPITQRWFSLPTPTINPNEPGCNVVTALLCKGIPHQTHPQYYKVVRVIGLHEVYGHTLPLEILSSDDQKQGWKKFEIKCSSSFYFPSNLTAGIISEETGVVYLHAYHDKSRSNILEDLPRFLSLLVFDNYRGQKERSYPHMILPPKGGKLHDCPTSDVCKLTCMHKYGQSNGHIIFVAYAIDGHYLELWVLDEDTKEWDLNYRLLNLNITNHDYFGIIEDANGTADVLACHPLDPHLLLMQVSQENLVWFNIKTRTMELIRKNRSLMIKFCLPYIWPSLSPSFSLDSNGRRKGQQKSRLSRKAYSCGLKPKGLVLIIVIFIILNILSVKVCSPH